MSNDTQVKQEDRPTTQQILRHYQIECGPLSIIEKDILESSIESALATVRREVWQAAIKVAQESTKKSQAAKLNIAAAEILIRRLERAATTDKETHDGRSESI